MKQNVLLQEDYGISYDISRNTGPSGSYYRWPKKIEHQVSFSFDKVFPTQLNLD